MHDLTSFYKFLLCCQYNKFIRIQRGHCGIACPIVLHLKKNHKITFNCYLFACSNFMCINVLYTVITHFLINRIIFS